MSLLKTNEIQNYNGSSLTLTASTVSTSAQLNTGGNISVTGSLNVSDDSTTRTNLGLGTIATQDSDSITVTGGTATLGALTVSGSDSGDLVRITQTGSGNALVVEDSANPDSTPFVVDSSGKVGIGTDGPTEKLNIVGGGIDIKDGSNPRIRFYDNSNNFESGIEAVQTSGAMISGSVVGDLAIRSTSDILFAAGGNIERMRIDSSGKLLVGTNSAQSNFISTFENGGTGGIFALRNVGGNGTPIRFFTSTSTVAGSISTSGATTSYVTSSDYRLKEDWQPMSGSIDRVKALNPVNFAWKVNGLRVDGFLAHEVQDIVPEAISGEKDAVNEDGSINPQGLDLSKLVPLLTAALKEAIAKIESLETRIVQLELKK